MDSSSEVLPNVRKIAVLRANAIGDYIFTLPALEALRAAYPEAEIVLLGQEWHARFLDGRPGPVDRVVVVPKSRGVTVPAENQGDTEADPAELEHFFNTQVREGYDLAIQLHGGGRHSNPFIRRLGAKMTIGLKTPDAIPLDRWIPYIYFQPEIFRFLEVVSLVGASPRRLVPSLRLTDQDTAEAARFLTNARRPLVAFHPGAGDPRRRWAPEKFAAVGDALMRAGARVVVTGTAAENQLIGQIVAAMQPCAENLSGCLSLGGLAGLFASCDLVISNDSGPLHLAEAVGAATVGIYWCGNLINAEPVTRARHRPVLSWRLDCPICGRNTIYDPCDHRVSYLDVVSVDEVLAAALDLLNTHRPAHLEVAQ